MAKVIERKLFVNKKTKQRSIVLPMNLFKNNKKAKGVRITIKEFLE